MKYDSSLNPSDPRLRQASSAGARGSAEVETEPSAGSGPVPLWLLALTGILLYVGDLYLFDHGGFRGNGFDARVYYPYTSFADLEKHQPHPDLPPLYAEGQKTYNLCAGCHGPDGLGNASSGFPPLAQSEWVGAEHADRAIRIVLNGLSGPVEVAGKNFGIAVMPTWRPDSPTALAKLSDEDIAGVITYIRNSWGNKASPVTPAQVAKIRKETADHATPWNADDLKKVAP